MAMCMALTRLAYLIKRTGLTSIVQAGQPVRNDQFLFAAEGVSRLNEGKGILFCLPTYIL